ncbi:9532_t:CDS:2 [Entrophospora sp. SA101]|nr:8216_t:CDS:2 [Entrophospora sp. SA101]CAJ0823363.1 9532_t:CDS:2 [Entrophospora sp. SA101]CAJ0838056.1 2855_t:CDS:2 [Entrophospora sp. SA101]CAJ0871784.1 7365_t:CDS:2 [Entrophospora sp. SA101]CAJ0873728.1 14008_t:CDS:2 [Entrophospora sp. SA101]
MTHEQVPGKTSKNSIAIDGNYTGGAIGPKLQSVVESMGYATANNSNPEIQLYSKTVWQGSTRRRVSEDWYLKAAVRQTKVIHSGSSPVLLHGDPWLRRPFEV